MICSLALLSGNGACGLGAFAMPDLLLPRGELLSGRAVVARAESLTVHDEPPRPALENEGGFRFLAIPGSDLTSPQKVTLLRKFNADSYSES